ncbi:SNARE domain [Musa troglodytarum]|uniref:SNARE domain n=1 Tax=Musa troglodytarum TaxID=320322 RepID=A0A9E7K983_9LILI|nr:SNARE domain [Musa troglodytarum]
MATSLDQWTRELNEASKLAEDISAMISERRSLPSGPDTQRHLTAMRRKITILRTRLESLESFLSKLPSLQPISMSAVLVQLMARINYDTVTSYRRKDKELHKRQEMLANLKSKANQMASELNMSNFGNRKDLFGDGKKSVDVVSITAGLDNQGIVGLQRQIMREQDEGLEKLEETVLSTKHIALAVNEELDLHTRLIDDLDEHVDITDTRLQRVQKRLAILSKRTKGGCSCMCLLLSVVAIVILIVIAWVLIKYL